MDVGTAITASTGIITGVGGGVAIVYKIFSRNGHCSDHSGFCTSIKGITEWLDKVEKKLDRVIEQRTIPRS